MCGPAVASRVYLLKFSLNKAKPIANWSPQEWTEEEERGCCREMVAVIKKLQKELMIFQSIGTNISRLSMIVQVNVVLNKLLLTVIDVLTTCAVVIFRLIEVTCSYGS